MDNLDVEPSGSILSTNRDRNRKKVVARSPRREKILCVHNPTGKLAWTFPVTGNWLSFWPMTGNHGM